MTFNLQMKKALIFFQNMIHYLIIHLSMDKYMSICKKRNYFDNLEITLEITHS